MKQFLHRLYHAVLRVFPSCITFTQAVAFNMFLAFFPMLLVAFAVIAGSTPLRQAFLSALLRLRPVLPPGTVGIANEFIVTYGSTPWSWAFLGLVGTLLAGTQTMKLLTDGFRMVHGDRRPPRFLSRHLRALLLLVLTIGPFVLGVSLIVFGRQVRGWIVYWIPALPPMGLLWMFVYVAIALTLIMLVLSVIYRVGRGVQQPWNAVFPGAAVATLLWWGVSAGLGFYLQHLPYDLVYGTLAVTIGLLLWMQLTAIILFIGAAFNAEVQQSRP